MLERLNRGFLRPIDYRAVNAEAQRWLDMLGLEIDPSASVAQLSVAKMQLVEIAKALSLRSRVLLMDEPTASLTPHETVTLFALLQRLRDEGVAIVFVSHKLEEVLEICDSVTVLRDGRNACESRSMAGLGRQQLVRLMIGRDEHIAAFAKSRPGKAETALQLSGVATELGHRNINFAVHRGEILGLYGLVGAGRTELAKSIIGLHSIIAGDIRVNGRNVGIKSVADAIHRHGIGYVSEDRKQEGLILMHSILANAGITIWQKLARAGIVADRQIRSQVEPQIRKLDVRTVSLAQLVGNLSGGNQQKLSVAKWLVAGVDILIVDEPTVGIDIQTKAYIHELLRQLAAEGKSILLITSDMPEMIVLADRIAVMDDYEIKGEIANDRDYGRVSENIMKLIHSGTGGDHAMTAPN